MDARRFLHRHLFLLLAPIALLLLTGCTTQAVSPGRLFVTDETERLRRSEVAQAAAPLIQRGINVVVFIVERGDNTGRALTDRLTEINLQGHSSQDRIAPDAIAIYVSYEPRYAELRAGRNWSGALTDDVLTDIRTNTLNPALRNDNVTGGVVETLKRFESAIGELNADLWPWALAGIVVLVWVWSLLSGGSRSHSQRRRSSLWRSSRSGSSSRVSGRGSSSSGGSW